MKWLAKLFGSGGGARKEALAREARRDALSHYLPYVAYDPHSGEYHNTDNTIGHLWEGVPLSFAGPKALHALEALFRIAFPKGTVLQFILYPDPNIGDFIARFKQGKTREEELTRRNIEEFTAFLAEGVKGVQQLHGIPLRNFRLFVALKSPERISRDELAIVEETLAGVGLQPRRMQARALIRWLRELFNAHVPVNPSQYDETVPIRKQLIYAETEIDTEARNPLRIGSRYARCLTPKSLPKAVDALETNGLTGGILGLSDDAEQITTPFLWTLSVVFDDVKAEIHQKASLTVMQKASGSFAVQIRKRAEEFTWALSELDNERFLRVIPQLWVFGDNAHAVRSATARARRLWESKHYVMQEETTIAKPLLITALPFGLYASRNNLKTLDRDFLLPTRAVCSLLPIQADLSGSQDNPVLCYVGRKGQVVGVDVFDPRSNNHNFLVTAASGAGKSFSLNYLCSNYYAASSMVRIVDLGYSYQKLARTVGGRFMDFGQDKVCLNPFHSHAREEEDRTLDRLATANIVAEMVYSASGAKLSETEWTLIKDAVRWASERDGGEYGIDHVCEFLNTFPQQADHELGELAAATTLAREMAFNLRDFKSTGIYGAFFNGPSTFDIRSDDFVVLELERLKPQAELFRVITLQVLNAVTQDLYLSDRASRRFILFEEAWSYFDSGNRIGALIQEGYRRARKYHGSFGIVTQSLLDLLKFGEAGDVIRTNAAYKFYLESDDYAAAAKQNLLDYEGLALALINTVKNNKPRYSEVFLDTPFGRGPARLVVDPWTYWVNTSAGNDVRTFHQLMDETGDVVQTLEILTGQRDKARSLNVA